MRNKTCARACCATVRVSGFGRHLVLVGVGLPWFVGWVGETVLVTGHVVWCVWVQYTLPQAVVQTAVAQQLLAVPIMMTRSCMPFEEISFVGLVVEVSGPETWQGLALLDQGIL